MTAALIVFVAWAHAGLGAGQDETKALPPPGRATSAVPTTTDPRDPPATASAVRESLTTGNYPWYDAASGKVRPLLARKPGWLKSLGDLVEKVRGRISSMLKSIGKYLSRLSPPRPPGLAGSGDTLMTVLLCAALAGLLLALLRLWYRRGGRTFAGSGERALAGQGSLLAELAGADRDANVDPWTEAIRRRAAGDLAGAVVYLFVHQLVSLDQIGTIRLAPGMTGRQYVSRLKNTEVRRALAATLGLFEEAHYGHHLPTAAAFEAAWSRALAFRREVLGKRDES